MSNSTRKNRKKENNNGLKSIKWYNDFMKSASNKVQPSIYQTDTNTDRLTQDEYDSTVKDGIFSQKSILDLIKNKYEVVSTGLNIIHDYKISKQIRMITYYIQGKLVVNMIINNSSILSCDFSSDDMMIYTKPNKRCKGQIKENITLFYDCLFLIADKRELFFKVQNYLALTTKSKMIKEMSMDYGFEITKSEAYENLDITYLTKKIYIIGEII